MNLSDEHDDVQSLEEDLRWAKISHQLLMKLVQCLAEKRKIELVITGCRLNMVFFSSADQVSGLRILFGLGSKVGSGITTL